MFTKLIIKMGTFEELLRMEDDLKFKTYEFVTKATELILIDPGQVRWVLNKSLKWIDENKHKAKVELIIENRKKPHVNLEQKVDARALPAVPQSPIVETRQEIKERVGREKYEELT